MAEAICLNPLMIRITQGLGESYHLVSPDTFQGRGPKVYNFTSTSCGPISDKFEKHWACYRNFKEQAINERWYNRGRLGGVGDCAANG
jgi:hypothetical protein